MLSLLQTLLLSLSSYNLACHYFLHLRSTLCTHTCHISCVLLLCFVAQKIKCSSIKTSFRCAYPQSSACGVVLVPLLRPIGPVIKLDVFKHWLYIFHFLSLYM
jgi:hypothetical protein